MKTTTIATGLFVAAMPVLAQPYKQETIVPYSITVLGAVKNPGVYQVKGRKTVIEMLSLTGGLDTAAGPTLRITRRLEAGRLPLKNAVDDPTGQYSVATLNLKSLLDARDPADNIPVQPDDVIAVPRAEIVYVIGQVMKAGGFLLSEHESMTVLKALSLAGGLDRSAAPGKARILRPASGTAERSEIPVDVKAILEGKTPDVTMRPDDILFIPSRVPKPGKLEYLDPPFPLRRETSFQFLSDRLDFERLID